MRQLRSANSQLETFRRSILTSIEDGSQNFGDLTSLPTTTSPPRRSPAQPAVHSSPGPRGGIVDGKQFFRKARNALDYEKFNMFLATIKSLNDKSRSRDEVCGSGACGKGSPGSSSLWPRLPPTVGPTRRKGYPWTRGPLWRVSQPAGRTWPRLEHRRPSAAPASAGPQ